MWAFGSHGLDSFPAVWAKQVWSVFVVHAVIIARFYQSVNSKYINMSLLYKISHGPGLPKFCGTDTVENWAKNLFIQGTDWPWRDRWVRYTVNRQGYRAPQLDQINWAESILCFGCSMTFGFGVDDHDTWPSQLGSILGVPTVNLGIGGGSIQINWANSVRLLKAGIRPRAVVYYWPDQSRHCEFEDGERIVDHWGSWNKPVFYPGAAGYMSTAWQTMPQHARTVSQLMIDSLQWPCPRLDFTWVEQPLDGVEYRVFQTDQARDMRHPGPLSNRLFAESIARDLKI